MTGINRILQLTWEMAEKPTDDKTRLQAFAQLNEGYKFKMDLTTNGIVITDAIKFVQTNKEKLTTNMSTKEDNIESKDPDYDEKKDQQEQENREQRTTNNIF
jgi:DNA-binding protein